MKSINVNKLQSEVSKVIKECEKGTTFEVIRYSKPVAYLVSKKEYEAYKNHDCAACLSEIREVAKIAKKQTRNEKRKIISN